jgi:hypothetical protein
MVSAMMWPRAIAGGLLGLALVAGTISDVAPKKPAIYLGGYQVLAADFHVHTNLFSGGSLAPWDLVLEARRRDLDALAITPHNQVVQAKVGRWFSKLIGGPTVFVGEEVRTAAYHLIAVGIETRVSAMQPASGAIDDVHNQGGIAIAAHPVVEFRAGYDDAAMRKLDGSEVLHPLVYVEPADRGYRELQQFYATRPLTAIGSSDYHAFSTLGLCRTYVFARENNEAGIIEALRAGRTVVIDRDGRAYGDPALIKLAAQDARLNGREVGPPNNDFLSLLGRICAILGLLTAALFGFRSPADK